MDKILRLLTAAALSFALANVGATVADAASNDNPRHRGGSLIGATADDNAVQLRGSRGESSDGVTARSGARGYDEVARASDALSAGVHTLSAKDVAAALNAICVGDGNCGTRQGTELNPLILEQDPADPADPVEAAAAGEPARVVTVEDVARFLPADVTLHAEPDGWAVIGVPANFWTWVRPVTVEGALLGEQASVRFTPQVYRWDYGDGTSRSTRSGGASWSGLDQQELTETATSHLYRTKATVSASVTVIWSAEYRFAGGDWTPVDGAVSNSSPEVRTLVVAERTVLTAG